MDQVATPSTQHSSTEPHAGIVNLPINPILCSCDVLPAGYKTPPETEIVAQLLHTLTWVMLPSQLKLLRVLPGLVCLPFEFRFVFFFSCFPRSLPAPRIHTTCSWIHGSPSPRLQSCLVRRHSPRSFHPTDFPNSTEVTAASGSSPLHKRTHYTSSTPPGSTVPYPSPELPTKFDGPLRVFWNYYLFFIKCLRA